MTVKEYIEKTADWIVGKRKANEGNFCSTFLLIDERHWREGALKECEELAGVPEKFISYILEGELDFFIKQMDWKVISDKAAESMKDLKYHVSHKLPTHLTKEDLLDSGDGVHFSIEGYRTITDIMKKQSQPPQTESHEQPDEATN